MTVWRYRTQGPTKDFITPQKHQITASFWRSFGTIFLTKEQHDKRPGIIDWFYKIAKVTQETHAFIESYGMESDGNATSWLPVDEYYDTLDIDQYVLTDLQEDGWVFRIVERESERNSDNLSVDLSRRQAIRNVSRTTLPIRSYRKRNTRLTSFFEIGGGL